MSNAINNSLTVIVLLVEGYLLQFFLGSFLESRFSQGKINKLCLIVIYGGLTLAIDDILPSDYGNIRIWGKKLLLLLIISMVTISFYKAVRNITVFLIITFMAVKDICFLIAYTILATGQYWTHFWLQLYEQGYWDTVEKFMLTVEITLMILQIVMFAISLVLCYLALRKIVVAYKEKEYPIQKKELQFIMIPSLVGLLLCILLRMLMITVEDEGARLLYDTHPLLIILVPGIMLLSLMSIFYAVQLFQDMIILNRERNNRIILEKQMDNMQVQIKEVERVYSGVRSMKHDMKNSLSIIMHLVFKNQDNENVELQEYLSELNQKMEQLEWQFKTGNSVVDTLLSIKYHEIKARIPDLQLNVDGLIFPEQLRIHSYDLGVILGNALDNAIEACEKWKKAEGEVPLFIRLTSFQRGTMFFVEIENSFDGKIIRTKHSEFPATSKKDIKSHGIGLANVKNIAEKYQGAVDWMVLDNVFRLTVMLKNNRRDGNEYWIDKSSI